MKRIALEDTKQDPVHVSKQDFEADMKRGYTAVEVRPAGQRIIRNRRNPAKDIVTEIPPVVAFRCMRCQFDAVNSDYKRPDGSYRSGEDLIREHVFHGDHPWPYTRFETPYGHVEDVTIEGIGENYSKEIEAWQP